MKPAGAGGSARDEAEIPWDLVDRCLLPIIFCHAASVILSTLLGFRLVAVFIPTLAFTLVLTLFYHTLKVTCAGKIVLVSGCESRIGYSIAKHLDDLGVTVLAGFSDQNPDQKNSLKETSSGRLKVIQLDVANETSIRSVTQFVQTNYPEGIWAVVNAASWTAFGEAEWVPPEAFRRMINVNLTGTITLTSALLPLIRKTKGRVVTVSSLHGRMPTGPRAPLAVTTAGLAAYSEALRLAMLRCGVDVVLIEAGATSTGAWYDYKEMLEEAKRMWHSLSENQRKDYGENYFEMKITTLREYRSQTEDLTTLLNSVGDAVTRTFPLPRYTPVTKKEKLQAFVSEHLPHSVYSILYQ